MNFNYFFPLTSLVRRGQPRTLVVVICIYLAVSGLVRILDWLVGWLPVLGAIFWALFWLVGLYCTVGIILAIWEYVRKS